MSNEERLDALKSNRKFIFRIYWHLMYEICVNFTMERMMGCSMTLMMIDAGKDLYPDDKEKRVELAMNHAIFFNTQQTFGLCVWGIALGMEIEKAKSGDVPEDMIQAIKTALAGPIAGMGDTIWQTLFIPIVLSIAMGMSANGSLLGPIFAIVIYFVANVAISYFLFSAGIKFGVDGAALLMNGDLKDRVISVIEVMGIIVIGAVVANNCDIQTALVFNFNGVVVDLQADVLDAVYSGILTIIGCIITYWVIHKKHISANWIMVGMLVIAIIGYFTTILA